MKFNKLALLSTLIVLFIFTSSCEINDPVEGVAVIFNQMAVHTNVTVEILDANTEEQIGSGSEVKTIVIIEGPDKDKVVNEKEEVVNRFETMNGVIGFSITSSYKPTAENPVEITIIAATEKYLTGSKSISIKSEGGKSYSISLVSVETPPEGTCIVTDVAVPSDGSGKLTSKFTGESCAEAITGGSASLEIEQNTIVYKISNLPLEGILKASINYFNNQTEGALRSFPGGLIALAENENGVLVNGLVNSAGFSNFSIINQNLLPAVRLSSEVTLKIDIPENTINPETNLPIKLGDEIPIWSYSEGTGIWNYEGKGTVSNNGKSTQLRVLFQAEKLGWWNLGWINQNVCEEAMQLTFTGKFSSLSLKIKRKDNGNTLFAENAITVTDRVLQLGNMPMNIPSQIEIYDNLVCSDVPIKVVDVVNLCGNDLSIEVIRPGTDVSVTAEAVCADRDPVLKVRPNAVINILNDCGRIVPVGKMINGKITLQSLQMNKIYVFAITYEGKWYTEWTELTQNEYQFEYILPNDICSDF